MSALSSASPTRDEVTRLLAQLDVFALPDPALQVLNHHTVVEVLKYDCARAYDLGARPYDAFVHEGNQLTPLGKKMCWKILTGQASANEFFNQANSYLFVGNSAAVVTGTGQPWNLQGSQTASVQASAVNIAGAGDTVNWQGVFDGNTGNGFNWQEFGIGNAATINQSGDPSTTMPAAGTLLNRAISSAGAGIKAANTLWTLSMTIQLV